VTNFEPNGGIYHTFKNNWIFQEFPYFMLAS
jgi:hypothetical protein